MNSTIVTLISISVSATYRIQTTQLCTPLCYLYTQLESNYVPCWQFQESFYNWYKNKPLFLCYLFPLGAKTLPYCVWFLFHTPLHSPPTRLGGEMEGATEKGKLKQGEENNKWKVVNINVCGVLSQSGESLFNWSLENWKSINRGGWNQISRVQLLFSGLFGA